VSEWYEFIDAQKALFPAVLMCVWAGVSRSGFYDLALPDQFGDGGAPARP
jgi:hypothetical protein